MGKYIITFEDNSEVEEDGVKYFRCTEVPWSYTSGIIISKLTPYTEPDLDAIRKYAYKDGREAGIKDGMCEAWEAARKIVHLQWDGAWAGVDEVEKWFDTYTASEAIEKIRQHEQEQGKIKVGDEVEAVAGKAVIIQVFGNGDVRYMYPDASIGFNDSCSITRTGRHFPEIAKVLRKMKE